MLRLKSSLLALLFISFSVFAQKAEWKVDEAHSNVQFTVSHMVISDVTGSFNEYSANVTSEGDDFTKGNIEFTINTKSIDTDNEKRDEHLRSDDFFNAEKYPYITFKGKSLKKVEGKKYKLQGDLTIRDVTKPVTLDVVYNGTVKDPWGNTKAGFKINGEVNRFDYNLKWNNLLETGGAVVGKDVELKVDLQLVKQTETGVSKK